MSKAPICCRCNERSEYGYEEINDEVFCVSCAEIVLAEIKADEDEAKEYELADLNYMAEQNEPMTLAQLQRRNDLLLWNILRTCDRIIASQKTCIKNMKAAINA